MLYDQKRWEPKPVKLKPKLEPWQKLMLKSAKIIEEKGWCRNHYLSHGRVCLVGALRFASDNRVDGLFDDVYETAVEKVNDKVVNATSWNDKQASRKPV